MVSSEYSGNTAPVARASRRASVISPMRLSPPGKRSGMPSSRLTAASTPTPATTFIGLPMATPQTTWGRSTVQVQLAPVRSRSSASQSIWS